MNAGEVREKSNEELEKLATQLKDDIFGLRFKHARGELKPVANIRKTKRDLARVKNEIVNRKQGVKA